MGVFVPCTGECDIFVKTDNAEDGEFGQKVHTVKSGDSFGELALMKPRTACFPSPVT